MRRVETFHAAHADIEPVLGGSGGSFPEGILMAELIRVHLQGSSNLVPEAFRSKKGIGGPKSAAGAAQRIVGIGAVGVDPDVGDLIRSRTHDRRLDGDLFSPAPIGAAIQI